MSIVFVFPLSAADIEMVNSASVHFNFVVVFFYLHTRSVPLNNLSCWRSVVTYVSVGLSGTGRGGHLQTRLRINGHIRFYNRHRLLLFKSSVFFFTRPIVRLIQYSAFRQAVWLPWKTRFTNAFTLRDFRRPIKNARKLYLPVKRLSPAQYCSTVFLSKIFISNSIFNGNRKNRGIFKTCSTERGKHLTMPV